MYSKRFFIHPRVYFGMDELCAKEINKLTGTSNARLVTQGDGRFYFEDDIDPNNQYFDRFIGVVDPTADINLDDIASTSIFLVDDDEKTGKMIVIATDGSNGLDLDLFYRLASYYNL